MPLADHRVWLRLLWLHLCKGDNNPDEADICSPATANGLHPRCAAKAEHKQTVEQACGGAEGLRGETVETLVPKACGV